MLESFDLPHAPRMQRFPTLLLLAFALGLSAESASALGLGKVGPHPLMGRPLDFTVGLLLRPGETLESRCARAEVSFGDRVLPARAVRTRVETVPGSGERRVRVATSMPVNEPVVSIHLQLGCPPSLVKSYNVFADSPAAKRQAPLASADARRPAPRPETAVSPVFAAAQPEAAGASSAHTPPRAPAAAEPATAGAAAGQGDPQVAQLQQEVQRLKAVEGTLLQLRSENEGLRQSLAELQQRWRAAEESRYANPVVYFLTGVCALLIAGLAAMWHSKLRKRAEAVAPATPRRREAPAPRPPAEKTTQASVPASPTPKPKPAPIAPATAATPAVPPQAREPDTLGEQRRSMSAEELIDLEQQVDFFVVLGQDEAAIALLMGHLRSTAGASPLPYLKLLEIYRRRGEREPYDRMREHFNQQFNAFAPEWEVDLEQGRGLEDYPEVMQRLQGVWRNPSQAKAMLDAALFRHDEGPTFDVPAYRELLFLYSTACDLAERDAGPDGVDFLLPLGDESPPTMTRVPPSSAQVDLDDLDLDVSTDRPPTLSPGDTFKRSGR